MPRSEKEKIWFSKLSGLKHKAEAIFAAARRAGQIVTGTHCENCGWEQPIDHQPWKCLHAHHDDYTKPLDVRWLCPKCHRQWHAIHGDTRHHAIAAASRDVRSPHEVAAELAIQYTRR